MNVKEYISSGILELYVAGALDEAEAKQVEQFANTYPEIKAEIEAISEALKNYAFINKREPSKQAKEKILRSTGLQQINSTTAERYSKPKFNYLMAAVVAFLTLNIVMNIYFFTKLKDTEKNLAKVIEENKVLKTDYEKIKSRMEKKTDDLKMVMNRGNKIIDMKGMEIAPNSFATVYWNPNDKHVMLNVENLPMPPTNKQYQLWALKDGKPIDAGVFNMSPESKDMHLMKEISDADAFAITLEPMGGNVNPTLSALYVMGKI